jgi:tetratricopeptide (TPR) repeat protein
MSGPRADLTAATPRSGAAEALLAAAVQRFPHRSDLAIEFARLATARGHWPEALRRWLIVVARLPHADFGYVELARGLRACGEAEVAGRLLATAARRFPASRAVAVETATRFAHDGDWAGATAVWERVRAFHPDHIEGYLEGAAALRGLARTAEATRLLDAAAARFPQDADAFCRHAANAEQAGAAAQRWQDARQRFPGHAPAFIGLARSLVTLGRPEQAEPVLAEAIRRFPGNAAVFIAYATLATDRADWPTALARWTDAHQRFPADEIIAAGRFGARLRLLESSGGAADQAGSLHDPDGPAMAGPAIDDRGLFMCFESLGGTLPGCEFGVVQRRMGAEPLGLLRWTNMPPECLAAALEARLAGVGDPENTELVTQRGDEYMTGDRRFNMHTHTFVSLHAMPPEQMLQQSCRRLRFLRDKLLTDIAGAGKIFVYKHALRNLHAAELERIFAAFSAIGPSTLLYVARAGSPEQVGLVEQLRPRLLRGWIDEFAHARGRRGPSLEVWRTLCRQAHARWQGPAESSAAA